MNTDSEHTSDGPGSPRGELPDPETVLALFVRIQEEAKMKNGLALLKNAPAQD